MLNWSYSKNNYFSIKFSHSHGLAFCKISGDQLLFPVIRAITRFIIVWQQSCLSCDAESLDQTIVNSVIGKDSKNIYISMSLPWNRWRSKDPEEQTPQPQGAWAVEGACLEEK